MSLYACRIYRDMDDDSAPVDYSFVASANEAARQRQQQNIKREQARTRHSAYPGERRDATGRSDAQAARREPVPRGLPTMDSAEPQAQSVAYPDDFGIPDNPFVPPPQRPRRASVGTRVVESATREDATRPMTRRSRVATPGVSRGMNGADARDMADGMDGDADARRSSAVSAEDFSPTAQAGASRAQFGASRVPFGADAQRSSAAPTDAFSTTAQAAPTAQAGADARYASPVPAAPPVIEQNGAQYEPPASIDVPEWLRVAQQNHLPLEERRAIAPRVQSAPPATRDDAPARAYAPTDPLGRPLHAVAQPPRPANALPQSAREYADAGYPPELLREQARLEQQREELSRRRRHGAQYAVNPYQSDAGAPRRSAAGYGNAAQAANGAAMPRPAQSAANGAPQARGAAYAGDAPVTSGTPYQNSAPYPSDAPSAPVSGMAYAPIAPRTSGAPTAPDPVPDARPQSRSPYARPPAPPPGEATQSTDADASQSAPAARSASYSAAVREEPAYIRRAAHRPTTARESGSPHSQSIAASAAASSDTPYQVVDERWRDEESDRMPAYEERAPIPWLAIAMFVAAFIAVGLWLLQLTFTSQREALLRAREGVSQTLLNRHPYHYREMIEQTARKYNLDPAFVAAIVLNESSFNPNAVSDVGARGLMQLVDRTASWVHEKMAVQTPYDFEMMFEEQTNVEYGCWYLSFLCERFRGDAVLVAAGFHAGQNEVQNWLNDSRYSTDGVTIKLEDMMDGPTKQYATRVVCDYSIYLGLYYTEENT